MKNLNATHGPLSSNRSLVSQLAELVKQRTPLAAGLQPESLTIVKAGRHAAAPVPMFNVPLDGCAKAVLELMARGPSELLPDAGRVEGITPVMAGPVWNEPAKTR